MRNGNDSGSLLQSRALLLTAAAIWGLGFPIGKTAIAIVGATWFTAIRFLGAGLVLLIIFFPRIRRYLNRGLLRAGVIMGVVSFLGFWTQFLGLGWTTPSKNAFLSACYCVTVPFIWWVVRRTRPTRRVVFSALLCVIGIGFVSLNETLTIGMGDAVSILSAFVYGAEIVVISIQMRDHDVMTITVVQQITSGVLALIVASIIQPALPLVQLVSWDFIAPMLYVIFFSAAFGSIAQNIAQSRLSASESGLLCSTESVFCSIFSVALFGEMLTSQMVIGFILIFIALIVAQIEPKRTRELVQHVKKKDSDRELPK